MVLNWIFPFLQGIISPKIRDKNPALAMFFFQSIKPGGMVIADAVPDQQDISGF
jgi:hypothetical protein